MKPTRRWWGVVALGIGLAALAAVVESEVLLLAPVGLGAYLLAHQYRFLRATTALSDRLSVEQSLPTRHVLVGQTTTATLSVTLDDAAPIACEVTAAPPVAASGGSRTDRTVALAEGDETGSTTLAVEWPSVGRYAFAAATVACADDRGLFRTSFSTGTTPTATVAPRRPRNLHVGEGGDRIRAELGDHRGGRLGVGFEPAELRPYTSSDAVRHIDWKATARLNEPYVREYETETDLRTVIVFDHRATTATGRVGETELDYAREVALGFVDSADEQSDPLGLSTVGDGGTTWRAVPGTGTSHYDGIRRRLYDLEPTDRADRERGSPGRTALSAVGTPARAGRVLTRLAVDDGEFARTLTPYLSNRERYVERATSAPLVAAVRRTTASSTGTTWTILVTDDADPTSVREAVSLARHHSSRVLAFLLPRVLYEPGGLADLEAAYDRYVDFEDLRRDLARLDGVSAFEVAPGDRLAAVLDAGRERRAAR